MADADRASTCGRSKTKDMEMDAPGDIVVDSAVTSVIDAVIMRLERLEYHVARTCLLRGGHMCGELFGSEGDVYKGFQGEARRESDYSATRGNETVVLEGKPFLDLVAEAVAALPDCKGMLAIHEISSLARFALEEGCEGLHAVQMKDLGTEVGTFGKDRPRSRQWDKLYCWLGSGGTNSETATG